MGPQLKAGDVVTYNGWTEEQVKWGGNDCPYMMIVGRQYTIESVDVHSSHTKVTIKGITGRFNSVHFSN
jgi:hypothetical protein